MNGLVLGALFPPVQDVINALSLLSLIGNLTILTILAPLEPLLRLLVTTDPKTTYANLAVIDSWQVMVVVANALLVVFVMTGGLQMMIGRATGTIYLPPQEFFPKLFAVAISVNFSLLFGHILIDFNNALCSLTQFDMLQFITFISQGGQNTAAFLSNQGNQAGHAGTASLSNQATQIGPIIVLFVLKFFFVIVFLFTIFQLVGRLVIIDLLLVLSPVWMLMLLLAQTKPYAEFSSRVLTITIFEQAIQLIAFTVGAKFLLTAGIKDPFTMLVMGTGMMFTIGNIPRMLGRLKQVYGGMSGGLGTVIGMAVRVGMTLAA